MHQQGLQQWSGAQKQRTVIAERHRIPQHEESGGGVRRKSTGSNRSGKKLTRHGKHGQLGGKLHVTTRKSQRQRKWVQTVLTGFTSVKVPQRAATQYEASQEMTVKQEPEPRELMQHQQRQNRAQELSLRCCEGRGCHGSESLC
ncbi:hypothetical protein PHYPSEUDO_009113 [Phytophthora pseudosyringae]|uniref:Uncharacterized protein n=1 Tax=Phytophthora pseudosyringae TaxID=221518 RepID=A0A8T1VCK5_9STRA|nr:hypothetical protein PHYPSEUDO_009113 [Phytophthora pseudosyringae]